MTPEKLAELEALEAAGTEGPFEAVGGKNHFAGVRSTTSLCAVWSNVDPNVSDDTVARWLADAKFHAALRNNAFDLFAALREAWRERDEARAEVARLKELHEKADMDRWNALDEVERIKDQLQQATEKAAMFQQAAEDWRYIAKQYQDARKKESAAYEQAEIEALERLAALGCVCEGSESRVCVACKAQDALKKEA